MELEDKIISLETKIAYLENFITDLNQTVIDQDRKIRKLISETEAIKKEIENRKDKLPDNEKPPHY